MDWSRLLCYFGASGEELGLKKIRKNMLNLSIDESNFLSKKITFIPVACLLCDNSFIIK
jgi:hypothetical protein